ncbi:DNA mismatch repair endonuclease MutL [Candidatus Kuenenia sp.]|uniref:DNA mismatch repair endonuclease MutL n=1 Tax=Candidatus Kuenenia sp. TaxID=2499824 RepID=UPI0032203214
MGKVKILPPSVINKIAAGELIDRPAAVVKELVENAIDAEAKRIDVYLEDGGRKLIRISDDGVGIDAEDLALVFRSHTTSKLSSAEDLFAINTLGFRGEALPSIGAVSHSKITSRIRGAISGAEIKIEGGRIGDVRECGAPEGTQIEVQDLFFNTPVRKKFMKTAPTEMSYISDVLTRFALCYPNIHFTLRHNNRTVFNLPPVQEVIERIETFFGSELKKHLLSAFLREEMFSLKGYIVPPFLNKANGRLQFIFLNGRYIKDTAIYRAISDAYHGKLMSKRYPIVFLFLTVAPSEVDVNVHPTKTEVRFRNKSVVFNYVLSTLKDALNKSQPKSIDIVTPEKTFQRDWGNADTVDSRNTSLWEQFPFEKTVGKTPVSEPFTDVKHTIAPPIRDEISVGKAIVSGKKRYFQIHNAFIVEETSEGLNIIDQHALHEIILYHAILKGMQSSQSPRQRLLIPELVELNPKDFFFVLSIKEQLEGIGIEIEEFGSNTIMIRSFPQILKHLNGKEFIENLTHDFGEEDSRKGNEGVMNKLVNIMACKAAVKAGQRLEYQEIEELMEKKKNINAYTNNCPHGRPTTLSLSLDELYKHFKRK